MCDLIVSTSFPCESFRSHFVRLVCFHARVVDVAKLAVQWGQHLVPLEGLCLSLHMGLTQGCKEDEECAAQGT